jgi:hypothetical protein
LIAELGGLSFADRELILETKKQFNELVREDNTPSDPYYSSLIWIYLDTFYW